MTPVQFLAVGLLGGAGALARFLLDRAVTVRLGGGLPYGTFCVNILGCALLGALAGAAAGRVTSLLIGTGLIGAFTTFSTWMVQTELLRRERRMVAAGLYVLISVALGFTAVWLGRQVGLAL